MSGEPLSREESWQSEYMRVRRELDAALVRAEELERELGAEQGLRRAAQAGWTRAEAQVAKLREALTDWQGRMDEEGL